MVSLASGNVLKETENKASIRPEMEHHKVVITKVSLLVAWERLRKKSPDAKLMFQKSFAASYGDCTAFLSENQDEIGADILIVSDYSNDCEEGDGQSTEMAMRLQLVFSNFFGLKTFLDLEGSNKYGCLEADLRLEEMKKYPVVVIVLADGKRSSFFDIILSLLHQMKDKHGNPLNWFIIQSNENIKVPDTLAYDKQRRFTVSGDDPIIPKVVSLCSPFEPKAFETWKEQILNDDASINSS